MWETEGHCWGNCLIGIFTVQTNSCMLNTGAKRSLKVSFSLHYLLQTLLCESRAEIGLDQRVNLAGWTFSCKAAITFTVKLCLPLYQYGLLKLFLTLGWTMSLESRKCYCSWTVAGGVGGAYSTYIMCSRLPLASYTSSAVACQESFLFSL